MAKGFMEYDQSKNRVEFLKTHLSQISLVICQVNWTLDTEAMIENLEDLYKILLKQLSELTSMIRDPFLQPELRRTLIALITQDVHNRDIIESFQ